MNFTLDFKNISHKLINLPSSKNQDRSFHLELFDGYIKIYSVFDGHGKDGTKYAEYSRDFIKSKFNNNNKLLDKDLNIMLNNIIEELNENIINELSTFNGGTTVTILIIRNNLEHIYK